MPPGAPTTGTVTPGTGSLSVSWTAPSSDGGSPITGYDLRHIETSADETVDSNWTVVDDVWTAGGGTLQHTLTGLTGGTQYDLQIRAVNAGGDGPWSAITTGMPTTATTRTDYDVDDDGLIEITSAVQLNAIRWDLDGDGAPALANASDYAAAFPNATMSMGCPSTGCTGYELTADIDLDVDPYNTGAGWEPIGTVRAEFTATFEGNSNTISGLFINRSTTAYAGLFSDVDRAGVIQNVGLVDTDVTGSDYVGGLAGYNSGTITASYAMGAVSGNKYVGGLVGRNGGTIEYSRATGTVSGTDNQIGGLVGTNTGTIEASYATGVVSEGQTVGGLVGTNWNGTIEASYATGAVSGNDYVGGLVGDQSGGMIEASYATGTVSGNNYVGGLVGYQGRGTIEVSYATGAVSGNNYYVGGLVGSQARGAIEASYATGAVSGNRYVGGLVGSHGLLGDQSGGTIEASYATGTVSGNNDSGGLVGANFTNRGVVTASYWDILTSGLSTSTGGDGKMTSEFQSPTSHTGIFATWDSDAWDFGTSSQYPALKGLPISVDEQRQSHPAGDSVSLSGAPTIGAVTPGMGTLALSWMAPSSDGGSAITAYDLRHVETTADETVDSNWTVVDDVWTVGGGTLQHTLTGLTGGRQYDLQIRAVNSVGDGPWSATTTGTPTTATDYDTDDDALIEITSAAQLNAVRWDPDGDGAPASANASDYAAGFPNAAAGMGCPSSGCTGYELNANINLDTNGNDEADAGDTYWNAGAGWEPIRSGDVFFDATFEGNGNTISGLFINRSATDFVGLFSVVDRSGTIRNVGLTGVDVTGDSNVGGLVGYNFNGTIETSYASGDGVRGR